MSTKKPQPDRVNAHEAKRQIISTFAAASLNDERTTLRSRGVNKPISDDDLEDALLRLSHGDRMDMVTSAIGVDRSSLLSRATRDRDFSERLQNAQTMGAYARVEYAARVAAGEEGYSTGSIERDKLVCDQAWKWARTIGNRIFGDKLQVEQRTVTINLNKSEQDW